MSRGRLVLRGLSQRYHLLSSVVSNQRSLAMLHQLATANPRSVMTNFQSHASQQVRAVASRVQGVGVVAPVTSLQVRIAIAMVFGGWATYNTFVRSADDAMAAGVTEVSEVTTASLPVESDEQKALITKICRVIEDVSNSGCLENIDGNKTVSEKYEKLFAKAGTCLTQSQKADIIKYAAHGQVQLAKVLLDLFIDDQAMLDYELPERVAIKVLPSGTFKLTEAQYAEVASGRVVYYQHFSTSQNDSESASRMFILSKDTGEVVERRIPWRGQKILFISDDGEQLAPFDHWCIANSCDTAASLGGKTLLDDSRQGLPCDWIESETVWRQMLTNCLNGNHVSRLERLLSVSKLPEQLKDFAVNIALDAARTGRVRILQVINHALPDVVEQAGHQEPIIGKVLSYESPQLIEMIGSEFDAFGHMSHAGVSLALAHSHQELTQRSNEASVDLFEHRLIELIDGQVSMLDGSRIFRDTILHGRLAEQYSPSRSRVITHDPHVKTITVLNRFPTPEEQAQLSTNGLIYACFDVKQDAARLYVYDAAEHAVIGVAIDLDGDLAKSLRGNAITPAVVSAVCGVFEDADCSYDTTRIDSGNAESLLRELKEKNDGKTVHAIVHGSHYQDIHMRVKDGRLDMLHRDSLNWDLHPQLEKAILSVFGNNYVVYDDMVKAQRTSVGCSAHALWGVRASAVVPHVLKQDASRRSIAMNDQMWDDLALSVQSIEPAKSEEGVIKHKVFPHAIYAIATQSMSAVEKRQEKSDKPRPIGEQGFGYMREHYGKLAAQMDAVDELTNETFDEEMKKATSRTGGRTNQLVADFLAAKQRRLVLFAVGVPAEKLQAMLTQHTGGYLAEEIYGQQGEGSVLRR